MSIEENQEIIRKALAFLNRDAQDDQPVKDFTDKMRASADIVRESLGIPDTNSEATLMFLAGITTAFSAILRTEPCLAYTTAQFHYNISEASLNKLASMLLDNQLGGE